MVGSVAAAGPDRCHLLSSETRLLGRGYDCYLADWLLVRGAATRTNGSRGLSPIVVISIRTLPSAEVDGRLCRQADSSFYLYPPDLHCGKI